MPAGLLLHGLEIRPWHQGWRLTLATVLVYPPPTLGLGALQTNAQGTRSEEIIGY